MTETGRDLRQRSFEALLAEARVVHERSVELCNFAPWPHDLRYVDLAPAFVPAVRQMALWPPENSFHAAIQAVVPFGDWKRTYSEAEVGYGFLQDYGYIELFGPNGHFHSRTARAYVAYWGRGLYYPAHRHEAEELYFVISGSGTFEAEGLETVRLGPGQMRLHRPNQSHAMTFKDSPILTYILWRGDGMDGIPVMDRSRT